MFSFALRNVANSPKYPLVLAISLEKKNQSHLRRAMLQMLLRAFNREGALVCVSHCRQKPHLTFSCYSVLRFFVSGSSQQLIQTQSDFLRVSIMDRISPLTLVSTVMSALFDNLYCRHSHWTWANIRFIYMSCSPLIGCSRSADLKCIRK